jgi:hypothetical protein
MSRPYRGNPLFRSDMLRRGVALVAAVALAGTGAGVGYLALADPDRGRPLDGTAVYLAGDCSYDYGAGAVHAPVVLESVNDGEVVYEVTVGVTGPESGDVAASNRVSVATPDGRETTSVDVYVGMDQERWDSDGYQDCVLSLDF